LPWADRFAGNAQAVLTGLAVAGRPLTEDLLSAVTVQDVETARRRLRELAAARLLAEGMDGGGTGPGMPLWTRCERCLDLIMPGAYQRSPFMAAIFPEVAALAAVSATPPGAYHLLSAAQHALGYAAPPHRHDVRDALSIWATGREADRFLQPASAYAHARHHHDGTPRITEGCLTAEQRTATRFRRDRRAPLIPSPGPPMPYACRTVTPPFAMSISRHRS
jgi:hypothetical protein